MNITIRIFNKEVVILLKEGDAILDSAQVPDERNLAIALLPAIDTLLVRNNSTPENLDRMEVETDLGESYTSRRIAEAVANAFNRKR
jgi:tRNA A37 threonylcarbamoyladenosine modification protein TsaB